MASSSEGAREASKTPMSEPSDPRREGRGERRKVEPFPTSVSSIAHELVLCVVMLSAAGDALK